MKEEEDLNCHLSCRSECCPPSAGCKCTRDRRCGLKSGKHLICIKHKWSTYIFDLHIWLSKDATRVVIQFPYCELWLLRDVQVVVTQISRWQMMARLWQNKFCNCTDTSSRGPWSQKRSRDGDQQQDIATLRSNAKELGSEGYMESKWRFTWFVL